MIVIADTSPLNYLIRLQQTSILPDLYQSVIIPSAVSTELEDIRAPAEVRAWIAAPPLWLEIRQVSERNNDLSPRLGPGERQAILLALQLNATTILVDDLPARVAAENRHLHVTGTLAVLAAAARLNLLDLGPTIDKLLGLGFRTSHQLIARVLATSTNQ